MSVATPTDEFVFRLNTVSVVITAEFHNPSILNRDFLASQGIVPPDWEVTASIITPPVSVVRYENGIEWTVDQSRLNVMEKCGSLFRKDYSVHRLVNAYLEKLPHVPYRSLGLNCNVSMAVNNPQHWITERLRGEFASRRCLPESGGSAVRVRRAKPWTPSGRDHRPLENDPSHAGISRICIGRSGGRR